MVSWKAVYNNGTYLTQYNENGTENKYTDINRLILSTFLLIKDSKPILIIHLDKNKRLIYRKRVTMTMDNRITRIVHLVGWQENKNGVNIQCLCFVFPDGHIEVLDRFRKDAILFSPVKFLREEEI